VTDAERYRLAFLDWLACAARGFREPAAAAALRAADGLPGQVTAAGCAGHVLDYDDTYAAGLVHASAASAPAALVPAAARGLPMSAVLSAYAAGFEATAALAAASHPALYERGWHPTSVCGAVGAAVAAARLAGLDAERERTAMALALLRAGGLQAAFGNEGKALQVGLAAATGFEAAELAAAGIRVGPEQVASGFEAAYGASWGDPHPGSPAIRENWIKAHPCCLMTHGPIDAAQQLHARGAPPDGDLTVRVHPTARRAAPLDDAPDGLRAKFSIPYTTAYTLLHGPPGVDDFAAPDPSVRAFAAQRIRVTTDDSLLETEARIEARGAVIATVLHARGSPQHPMDRAALARKVEQLAPALLGVLDDPGRPAADVIAAAGLG
jgi:2-methylcitrate dehydratase PrpD